MQHRHVLYLISWLATVCAGLSATLFSVYLPSIVADINGVSTPQAIARTGSYAGAAFLLGWAIGGVFLGAMGDRIGRKRALLISTLACTLGMGLTSFVVSLPDLVILRALTGAGAGGILLITAVLVSEAWANSSNRARMVGILINAFPVGFILSGAFQALTPDFRSAYLFAGATIVVAVAVQVIVKESDLWSQRDRERKAVTSVWHSAHRRDLVVGLMLFGSMLVGLWAAYTWMPTWVSSISTPDQQRAARSITISLLGVGAIIGGIISGTVSNMVGRRKAAAIGYLGAFGMSCALFLQPQAQPSIMFGMTLVLSLFIGFNQGVLTGYIPELFPTLVRASATGISFNVGRLVTAVTVFFVGVLVTVLGGYDKAIFAFAFAYVIGFLTLFSARETRGQALPD